MHFSFAELIAHVSKTRSLTAGTIVGGGTVSSAREDTGVCCIVEQRMREVLEGGLARTPYLHRGDRIRIEAVTPNGDKPFGTIEHVVGLAAESEKR